ncbi:MAG TPA: sigma-70 family RNA polymerase sigma factor [Methyloradius sp.]
MSIGVIQSSLLRPLPALKTAWYGIDLRWAYAELLPTICRRTYCRQYAFDILHDALVRFALTKNPNRDQQPHAYLQVIVRNVLIDEHNNRLRFVPLVTEELNVEDNTNAGHLSDQSFSPSAEHLADIQQRLKAMQTMINNLPPRCREAFWMFRIEGLDQAEIAQRLGITRNMVQRHVTRAMVELLEADDLIL